jgi:hypothetical protein
MTLLRIGVRLSENKRHEKVPAALAGCETDTGSHLCLETRYIFVPWAQLEHANPDVDLSHPRPCVRGEAETSTRAKENGARKIKLNLTRWFCHPPNWQLRL